MTARLQVIVLLLFCFFYSENKTSAEDKLHRCSGRQMYKKDVLRLLAEIHFISAEVCKHIHIFI